MELGLIILAIQEAQDQSSSHGINFEAVLGPYGALALALGVIAWLTRAYTKQLELNRTLSDRLVEQAEKNLPVLTRIASLMEEDRRAER